MSSNNNHQLHFSLSLSSLRDRDLFCQSVHALSLTSLPLSVSLSFCLAVFLSLVSFSKRGTVCFGVKVNLDCNFVLRPVCLVLFEEI
jgi:hypothetical protein